MCPVLSPSIVPALCNPMDYIGLRFLCLWNFPGKNTGVGCHFLLQGIFPDSGIELVSFMSPVLANGFFTTEPSGKPHSPFIVIIKYWLRSLSYTIYILIAYPFLQMAIFHSFYGWIVFHLYIHTCTIPHHSFFAHSLMDTYIASVSWQF